MELCKLEVRKLPGIEPGFVFEPRGPGVHLVVGPNAIGKSSLVRALRYLLAQERSDPPALFLGAEFTSGATRWQVERQGSQIVWRRNGEISPRPGLPGADQIALYRLSVEHLLEVEDASDSEMARLMRRELYGNLDLESLREESGQQLRKRGLGSRESKALAKARKALQDVENEYAALRRQEEKLPALEREIKTAERAANRSSLLQRAVELTEAVDARTASEDRLGALPPGLGELRGDELEGLDGIEEKLRGLREVMRDRRAELEGYKADLERTGFADSAPAARDVKVNEQRLQKLHRQSLEVEKALEEEDAAAVVLDQAARSFNPDGVSLRVGADTLRLCEEITRPLIAKRHRRAKLVEQQKLAGTPPDEAEVRRHRTGTEALRTWLAVDEIAQSIEGKGGSGSRVSRVVLGVAVVAVLPAVVLAGLQGSWWVSVSALTALAALAALVTAEANRMRKDRRDDRQDEQSVKQNMRRRFESTGLSSPLAWEAPVVDQRLEDVEAALSSLLLKTERAATLDQIELQVDEVNEEIKCLEKRKVELAADVGFDPTLPELEVERFVRLSVDLSTARKRQVEQLARLKKRQEASAETADSVQQFLAEWPADRVSYAKGVGDSPGSFDLERLQAAFDELKARSEDAGRSRTEIRNVGDAIRLIEKQVQEREDDKKRVFEVAGVAFEDRPALENRLELLPQWTKAQSDFEAATTTEAYLRKQLVEAPDVLDLVDGDRARLEAELRETEGMADGLTALVQRQTRIMTKLEGAGSDGRLEGVRAGENRAARALQELRDRSLVATAMETLLDHVDEEFKADQEPAVLRRAREIFGEVTAHAFDLRLGERGRFEAYDQEQGALRSLTELSTGTRMQLLLALRLAWTEAREHDGEALPFFLDEAMTTSDEGRFGVMARSLERMVDLGGGRRQIFYFSARRHEPVLWGQATGHEPKVIDLAAVRFPSSVLEAAELRVVGLPAVPAPDGRNAEEYGSLLGVSAIDPYLPTAGFHLFHLLRDELKLLHRLMEGWRIRSVGQTRALLGSEAATTAVGGDEPRRLLRQRCRSARTWARVWRTGRGLPVDRSVLELSGAVSGSYIERASQLVQEVQGDGELLIQKLRDKALRGFRTNKMDQLEQWLRDGGYVDDRERLSREARLREVLQQIGPGAEREADDARRVVEWLETAVAMGPESVSMVAVEDGVAGRS